MRLAGGYHANPQPRLHIKSIVNLRSGTEAVRFLMSQPNCPLSHSSGTESQKTKLGACMWSTLGMLRVSKAVRGSGTLPRTSHAGLAGVLDAADTRTLLETGTRFGSDATGLAVKFIFGKSVAVMGRRGAHCLSTGWRVRRYSVFRIALLRTPMLGSTLPWPATPPSVEWTIYARCMNCAPLRG